MLSFCKEDVVVLGLQISQMPFLITLLHSDAAITQDELSMALVIDKAATARALDQLEQHGLVSRRINPHNRRQKLVSATEKARSLADRLFAILQAANDIFTQGFSQDEIETIHHLLNRMLANARYQKGCKE